LINNKYADTKFETNINNPLILFEHSMIEIMR